MKHTLKAKARQIVQSPVTRKALQSMKPEKSMWGFLGIVLLLIVPEIVGFIWGSDITAYAERGLAQSPEMIEKYYYELLVMLFEAGGSWVNLAIGVALLVWFFF
ncbi:MAG: hypothetical protein JU82_07380 [Sulfuricurvum sp. MLSB]|uniref:hypothetical protein n=1 Tax=Sulfuricurvum sp. MLSB TaxID=1537917 RepID=UPI00050810D6|nr:hypothetical protein [Sulfuricurvum sp. MLSB]KFN39379.1 MAG: hypothetical protein JU82_07380 [Sulfuricurvum sp. MLSB]